MTVPQQMAPARRRPIPGAPDRLAAPAPDTSVAAEPGVAEAASAAGATGAQQLADIAEPVIVAAPAGLPERGAAGESGQACTGVWEGVRRRAAADYSTTRLVNFRIPVDLHDRFRELVREVEREQPRLRHPSLTELVIALLEEGPQTAEEVAELIRRKRAAEHNREVLP